MNFLSMKYFCTVEKERSITKAAEQLYITQQTLSAHIASIEKEVGRQLFIRHTPLELTYAGEVFLGYARQFMKLHLSMQKEFADIRSEESGILRVGVAHTRGRAVMPDLVSRYRSLYPKMQVHIVEASNHILGQKLVNKELDIVIANFFDNLPEIQSAPFYEEEVVLLIARRLLKKLYQKDAMHIIHTVQQERSLSALAEMPFLLGSQEDIAGRIGFNMISEADFIPVISAQSSNIETLLELCAHGAGACFCPEILAKKSLPASVLSDMDIIHFGEMARYQIRLGWSKQPYQWKAIGNFIELALTHKENYC